MRKNCFGLLFFMLALHLRPRNSIDNSNEEKKKQTKHHYCRICIFKTIETQHFYRERARRNERNWARNDAAHFSLCFVRLISSDFALSFCGRRLREYRFQSAVFPSFLLYLWIVLAVWQFVVAVVLLFFFSSTRSPWLCGFSSDPFCAFIICMHFGKCSPICARWTQNACCLSELLQSVCTI